MTDYTVSLTPQLINMATEGSMDSSLLNGKSIQRTFNSLMVVNDSDRKMVGRLQDGETFNDAVATVGDYPDISPINYIFSNDYYVDFVANPGTDSEHEVNNLMLLMNERGIPFNAFTDISFSNFIAGSKVLIPELENNDLDPDLNSDAKDALNSFVSNGGTLIMFDPSSGDPIDVLNDVFGFALTPSGPVLPYILTPEGASLFSGLSATLIDNNATHAVDVASLPTGSIAIYTTDSGDNTVATMIPYGNGKIYLLGWDWYNAAPQGSQDGGWNDLFTAIMKS